LLSGPAHDSTGEGDGGGDPDGDRLLDGWERHGVVSQGKDGRRLGRLGGHGRRWEHA